MLRSIPAWKLEEWKAFEELDPSHEERNEWGLAHVVQAAVRNGKPLSEFLLSFGDKPAKEQIAQSVETQEMLINSWCFINNEILKSKGKRD